MKNGILQMHRTITSNDVEGYASHLPPDEVQMTKDEDIVYKKGVLTHASGSTSVKLVAKVAHSSQYFIVLQARPSVENYVFSGWSGLRHYN